VTEPGTLLPSVRGLLRELEQRPTTDFASLDAPEAIAAYLEVARRPLARPRGMDVDRVEDLVVGERDVPVRIYQPKSDRPLPGLVYYHGGGWVVGDLELHDDTCRMLANEAQCIVVSAEYRLAPEHPFPTPLDDCWSVLQWAHGHLGERGWNGSTLAVGGTSSGGNLSAAVALRARNEGLALSLQLLLYPALDSAMATPSWRNFASGYFLTAAQMAWYWRMYAAQPGVRRLPDVSPSHSTDLAGLAPAVVVTAEFDVLRDEAEDYARRMREAGVPVRLWRFSGQIHGFLSLGALLPEVQEAKVAIASLVGAVFANGAVVSDAAAGVPPGVVAL
jgi:acetyl esterase